MQHIVSNIFKQILYVVKSINLEASLCFENYTNTLTSIQLHKLKPSLNSTDFWNINYE